MKFFTCLISFLSLISAVPAYEFYVSNRNITCSDVNGRVTCEHGKKPGVEELEFPLKNDVFKREDTTVTIRGREVTIPGEIDKRATCSAFGDPGCIAHCFAIGYCDSKCDDDNFCHCMCLDKTAWWNPLVCSKTTCS